MSETVESVPVWGITDGSAGMAAQVRAVAEALGLPYVMKSCVRRKPCVWLPNDLALFPLRQLAPGSDALAPPWPRLVLTCGRRSAPLGAAIRQASGGMTKAVHIQHPQMRLSSFDLVVAMEHDHLTGPNVISTAYALHSISPEILARAAETWRPHFNMLPRPYIAVLIGGSTNKYRLDAARMEGVITQLAALERQGGSLLITASRRTGEENRRRLEAFAAAHEHVYLYDGTGENPYPGMLGLADWIVATDDSVNMMSEAAATGKPLYLLHLPGHENTKPARFAAMLMQRGVARPLGAELEKWTYATANESARVAEAVRRLISV